MLVELIFDADIEEVYFIVEDEGRSGWSGEGICLKKYWDSLKKQRGWGGGVD